MACPLVAGAGALVSGCTDRAPGLILPAGSRSIAHDSRHKRPVHALAAESTVGVSCYVYRRKIKWLSRAVPYEDQTTTSLGLSPFSCHVFHPPGDGYGLVSESNTLCLLSFTCGCNSFWCAPPPPPVPLPDATACSATSQDVQTIHSPPVLVVTGFRLTGSAVLQERNVLRQRCESQRVLRLLWLRGILTFRRDGEGTFS